MRYLSVYIDFVERKQNRGNVQRYFLANKHRTGNVIRRLSLRQLNDRIENRRELTQIIRDRRVFYYHSAKYGERRSIGATRYQK